MISYTHIEAGITNVEDITLEPLQSDAETGVYQRTITVRTKQGDSFDLVLRAVKIGSNKHWPMARNLWIHQNQKVANHTIKIRVLLNRFRLRRRKL
jgi:hypothetical protein